jgi:pimeloyl-ACP methyl ester carboxylesterase
VNLHVTADTTRDGVRERDFVLDGVTGALWSPLPAPDGSERRAPLVLLGHGGGTHRKAPAMTGRARRLVAGGGFHVAAVDAPGHGGRPLTAHDEREIAAMRRAMDTGEPVGPIVQRYNAHLAEQAVPEWRSVLDALQQLPGIGTGGPVGYFGLNMGTAIGVPLIAADPRITAAVLGVFWHESVERDARRITVPLRFLLQWDDEHVPRASALALFDAFGSEEKSLHAHAGRHKQVPRSESDSAVRFFVRHLGGPAATPA